MTDRDARVIHGAPPENAWTYLATRLTIWVDGEPLRAGEAVARLERMIGHHELSMLDEDERIAKDYSPGQKVTVLRQFMSYWGPHPPQPEQIGRAHV